MGREKANPGRNGSTSLDSGYVNSGNLEARRRVLFLAHHFPPLRAIPCVRTWNVAKNLARRGWEVNVLTPDPTLWKCVDDPQEHENRLLQENIRSITTGHDWRCLIPEKLCYRNTGMSWIVGGLCRRIQRRMGIDRAFGWLKPAERACCQFGKGDFDVILATGDPFITFRLAKQLAEKVQCPYVLDYRDPWTDNPYISSSILKHAAQEEFQLFNGARAVTVVSPSWASALGKKFNDDTKVRVLTNGYDPEELVQVQPYQFDHKAIVYTGRFYLPKRGLSPVMAALQVLTKTVNANDHPWLFHYYGPEEQYVRAEACRFGVKEYVVCHGNVARKEVLSAVRGASVAVVISSVADHVGLDEQGMIPGKLYEAIGLRTPVLLIASANSDARAVLKQVGAGGVFMGKETRAIAECLKGMLCGEAQQPALPDEFSWSQISCRLDAVLKSATQEERI